MGTSRSSLERYDTLRLVFDPAALRWRFMELFPFLAAVLSAIALASAEALAKEASF